MIDQLRIQCPSCGIILDVRNSKHEAVKRITCPHCKKQLAVNFEDEIPQTPAKSLGSLYYGEMRIDLHEGVNQIPLPACSALEINAVRLKDGSSKCLVHALNEKQPVLVNGEPLGKDDEVALTIGDELKIGKSVLTYGQPNKAIKEEEILAREPKKQEQPKEPKSQFHCPQWAIACIALLVALVAVRLLWPSKQEGTLPPVVNTTFADSIVKDTTQKKVEGSKPNPKGKEKVVNDKVDEAKEPVSEFELEKHALNGNMEAQYELGSRLVHRSGSSNVIRGINYLRLAANNGSAEARNTLVRVINTLQRKADHGDSIAYQVLMSIDHQ